MGKIKDYIYLDESLLNSLTAQFGKGLVQGVTSEFGSDNSVTTSEHESYSGGIEGILTFGIRGVREGGTSSSETATESQKELIDSIVHDYAVDLLIKNCKNESLLIQNIDIATEGDFILVDSAFHIYDFEYTKNLLDENNLKLFTEQRKDQTKELNDQLKALKKRKSNLTFVEQQQLFEIETQIKNLSEIKMFSQINLLSRFAETAFTGSILIGLNNSLALCDKGYFRMNRSQLSMLNDANRKIYIFGIIVSVKKTVNTNGSVGDLAPNDLDKIPSIIIEIILGSFNILKSGDKFIKPIAIYFE